MHVDASVILSKIFFIFFILVLNYLFEQQVKPEYTCRFVWRPGSIALWDNRCVLHNPINDYHGYKRLLHRITLKGDKPA